MAKLHESSASLLKQTTPCLPSVVVCSQAQRIISSLSSSEISPKDEVYIEHNENPISAPKRSTNNFLLSMCADMQMRREALCFLKDPIWGLW